MKATHFKFRSPTCVICGYKDNILIECYLEVQDASVFVCNTCAKIIHSTYSNIKEGYM